MRGRVDGRKPYVGWERVADALKPLGGLRDDLLEALVELRGRGGWLNGSEEEAHGASTRRAVNTCGREGRDEHIAVDRRGSRVGIRG